MSQQTPTQELVAKDLHGYEWRFKHIYRGICTCGNFTNFEGLRCNITAAKNYDVVF